MLATRPLNERSHLGWSSFSASTSLPSAKVESSLVYLTPISRSRIVRPAGPNLFTHDSQRYELIASPCYIRGLGRDRRRTPFRASPSICGT